MSMRASLFTWVLTLVAATASAQAGEASAAPAGNVVLADGPSELQASYTLTLESRNARPIRVYYAPLRPLEATHGVPVRQSRLPLAEARGLTACTTPCRLRVPAGPIALAAGRPSRASAQFSDTTFQAERDFSVEVQLVDRRAAKAVLYSSAAGAFVTAFMLFAISPFVVEGKPYRRVVGSSIALIPVGAVSFGFAVRLRSHYRFRMVEEEEEP